MLFYICYKLFFCCDRRLLMEGTKSHVFYVLRVNKKRPGHKAKKISFKLFVRELRGQFFAPRKLKKAQNLSKSTWGPQKKQNNARNRQMWPSTYLEATKINKFASKSPWKPLERVRYALKPCEGHNLHETGTERRRKDKSCLELLWKPCSKPKLSLICTGGL